MHFQSVRCVIERSHGIGSCSVSKVWGLSSWMMEGNAMTMVLDIIEFHIALLGNYQRHALEVKNDTWRI